VNLQTTVVPDFASGVIVIALRGDLTVESVPAVRAVLLKCLAQSPDAVIVDVAELRLANRALLTVFPAALRTGASSTASTGALVLCAASPALSTAMNGSLLGEVAVYGTREQAMVAVAESQISAPRRISLRLSPTTNAPATARAIVLDACLKWKIDHLRGPATVVISELVSNAVRHAGTDIQLGAALRGDYLHLSVHDGSSDMPVPGQVTDAELPLLENGRGLHLIDVYTTAWGTTRTARGKTVWATLRTTPFRLPV
jgi:anti-anti-sigma regulatory factor/anti-sigma regulatory factor (Ser/Thr protein kinase)